MFERALFIAVATLLCLHPAVLPSAFAQEDKEEPERREVSITGEQADLNDEAVRAIIGGDHAKAVALLDESLLSVEANVIYLNLGKAYQGLGNCEKARESFEAALEAPVVESPSPEVVDKKVRASLQELDQECAAPPTEDDAGADVAARGDTDDQQDIEEPEPAAETPVAAAPVEESSSQNIWGMTLVGTGIAVAGGGAAMHLVARSKRSEITDVSSGETVPMTQREAAEVEDSANLYDTVGLSMAITGGVLAATGTYIWLTAPEETVSTVHLGPTADGWNVAWTLQF